MKNCAKILYDMRLEKVVIFLHKFICAHCEIVYLFFVSMEDINGFERQEGV